MVQEGLILLSMFEFSERTSRGTSAAAVKDMVTMAFSNFPKHQPNQEKAM